MFTSSFEHHNYPNYARAMYDAIRFIPIRYFALVARAKTEIVSVGPEGGRVARSYAGAAAEMALPANAVRKRVKVGLQLLAVPQKVADLVCGEVVVEAYPILNIYPARRMFHEPLEITMPVRDAKAAKERWKNCHPRSVCTPTRKTILIGYSRNRM